MTVVWIDGKYTDRANATVSVFDHGLLYGDVVFEGIRVYDHTVFRLGAHLDRLYDSAKAIWLEIPTPKAEFTAVVKEAVARSGLTNAYIRLVVTRGVGDLGLDPRKCPKACAICIVDTIALWAPDRYEKGLVCQSAATPIAHRENLSPRIKSLNYLAHIMAKMEAVTAGADDALMLDASGRRRRNGTEHLLRQRNADPHAARSRRHPPRRHPQRRHGAREGGRLRGAGEHHRPG